MSRIEDTFKDLEEKGEGALIGYLTLGDPDITASKALFKCLSEKVDILEIGLPFSDPIADGPTIQAAMDRALKGDVSTESAFTVARELRDGGVKIPFVFMTYYNIVLQYGVEDFLKGCRKAGVDGLLVSDLPLEESEEMLEESRKNGVDLIFLLAPTTPCERAERILSQARGFVYHVSLLGVTGAREHVDPKTIESVRKTLALTRDVPLVVGFGISRKEHVRAIMDAGAAGVVVGSAFVKIVETQGAEACIELKELASELKKGTR